MFIRFYRWFSSPVHFKIRDRGSFSLHSPDADSEGKSRARKGIGISFRAFLPVTTIIALVVFLLILPSSSLFSQKEPLDTQNYPLERSIVFAVYAANLPPASSGGQEEAAALGYGGVLLSMTDAAFLPLNVAGEPLAREVEEYVVQPGDTVSSIAARFDLDTSTILYANNLTLRSTLSVGDTLTILPVDGVVHKVTSGESVAYLSLRYQVYSEEIIAINGLSSDGFIRIGQTLIIPGGKPLSVTAPSSSSPVPRLAEFSGSFLNPAPGARRSQGLHYNNAVDLANRCGSPLLAAASGTVTQAKTSGWNGGLGRYVIIEHAGGIRTIYGHMQEVFVTPGSVVGQGEQIGFIGATGRVTGCHVHFEVRGARNPFAY